MQTSSILGNPTWVLCGHWLAHALCPFRPCAESCYALKALSFFVLAHLALYDAISNHHAFVVAHNPFSSIALGVWHCVRKLGARILGRSVNLFLLSANTFTAISPVVLLPFSILPLYCLVFAFFHGDFAV